MRLKIKDLQQALMREKKWVDDLMAENTQLRQALQRYGMHEPGCRGTLGTCTCGLAIRVLGSRLGPKKN